MNILVNISIVWGMVHVIFLFIMLFRSRYAKRETILIAVFGMGLLMMLNGGILVIWGIDAISKVFLFTCSIPSFIFFYILSEDKKFKFLFTFCLVDTVCLWIMAVTNILDYFLGGGRYVVMFFSRILAFPLVEYFMWCYLRKPYLKLQKTVEKGWGVFAGMTMLYYILLVVMVQFPTNIVNRPKDMFPCILVLLLMFFNYGTIFSALYRQLLLYEKQQSERVLQEQKNTLEAQLINQRRIRKMKHDMKGYTATLSGLIAAGEIHKAQEYLKGVEREMEVLGVFCQNPYLNAVIVHYYQRMQELGAECRMDIQIGEEDLPYMELCQILSNGLENVCDAIVEIPAEKRKASLQMKYNRDYLIIRIKNRCREDLYVEKGTVPGTDKEGHDHGFGLLSVREAAESLDGEMFCYTLNENFVLDVMVQVKNRRR